MSKKDDALKLALPDRRTVTAAGDPEDYINSGWNDCLDAIREALASHQPAYRAVKTFHDGKPVYVAEQPAQGCEFCSHPLYAGTKCKNCGKPAQQDMPKIGCVNHDCDKCKAQPSKPLTDEEIHKMTVLMGINPEWKAEMEIVRSVVRNLEAKLREKNT